jgi:hypothetical protein
MGDERSSWSVKDEAVHAELVQLLNLSVEEITTLGALKAKAAETAPGMTEEFYRRLTAHGNTQEYLQGVDLGRMHKMTGEWFIELFSGRYDADYVTRRLNIGMVHVRIGLPVRYPLAMLDIIGEYGQQVAAASDRPEVALRAFRKILGLDVAVFNQAYEDNQLRHLADLVGGERLARRLLAGLD